MAGYITAFDPDLQLASVACADDLTAGVAVYDRVPIPAQPRGWITPLPKVGDLVWIAFVGSDRKNVFVINMIDASPQSRRTPHSRVLSDAVWS